MKSWQIKIGFSWRWLNSNYYSCTYEYSKKDEDVIDESKYAQYKSMLKIIKF